MKKRYTSIFIVLIAILLFGFINKKLETYESESYIFQYPSSYKVEKSKEKPVIVTVKGEKSRVEIFKTSDFDIERMHGFSSSGEEGFEYKLVPKEKLKKQDFTLWLFYHKDDKKTQKKCKAIFNSMELK